MKDSRTETMVTLHVFPRVSVAKEKKPKQGKKQAKARYTGMDTKRTQGPS